MCYNFVKRVSVIFFCFQTMPYFVAKQKLVFTLRDIEEMEVAEVEKITGLSAEKIKSNLYLARKYIREKLETLID